MRWWPWGKGPRNSGEPRPVTDQLVLEYFGRRGVGSITVDEDSVLGLSAFFRAMSLISGTLASLPFRSFTKDQSGRPRVVGSIFDDPDTIDGQTPYEWKETLFLHLLLHGRAGALKMTNAGGGLARLPLVHPLSFTVERPRSRERPAGGLWFRVHLADGRNLRLDRDGFWYVPGLSSDGVNGLSLIDIARRSLGTTLAGDEAARVTFEKGAMISGLATPADDDIDIADDLPQIRREIRNATLGVENAGSIAVINRRLNFTPWTMTLADAQFLQSRQFQIEEVARWTGVPPHLLMQTEKQTSWGTGVDEQNRGLSKFVLGHWSSRVEQRASRLLAAPRWCEFDFAALERPNFETNVGLVLQQIEAGLISPEYGRTLLNIPPEAAPKQDGGRRDAPPNE